MNDATERDATLLARMLEGDEDAFLSLYRRHHPAVLRFAWHMSGTRETAEDVTQEVFLALLREAHRYDHTRGSLGAYLFGTARHLLAKSRRRQSVALETVDIPGPGEGAFDGLARAESIGSVRRAVLSLPGAYREVVVLCELEEMDYAQAAEVLGCAIGTVRSRLHRARSLLAAKLGARTAHEPDSGLRPARCNI